MLELDRILEKCGDRHRLQAFMLLLFCVINLLSAMHYYSQTIISFVPTYWCANEYALENNTSITVSTSMTPLHSSCHPQHNNSMATCDHFHYDLYMGYESFTSELNWICDDAWKLTLGQSMFFVGSVVGSLIFGILADHVGRLPILIVANIVAMMGNILTIFGTTLVSFSFFRFLSGLATDSNFVMMYILVMEYLRPSLRTIGLSICIGIFYCLGSMAAPWIAVLMKSWRGFLLATSIPLIMVPFFYFIVPESVQWLISKQKYDKAVECLKRVAKINGKVVEESIFVEFIEECKRSHMKQPHNKVEPNLFGLFATPRLRRNTLILFFKSMVITLCYDAVSRNVQGLGISPFVMFSLSATTILPACLLLIALQDRIGRKAMASMSLLLSGIFISVTGAILFRSVESSSDQNITLVIILSVIGRFGVTVAYNSSAQYATELIPTCVRGQGVAAVHVMGYAFTFFSSYILHTRQYFSPLPEIILGTISLLGAGLCLLLPETLNKTLPTSLKDGEHFGKNERWYSFSFMQRRTVSVDTLAASTTSSPNINNPNGSVYF